MKRREAIELNLIRYRPDRPCSRGHISDRYTSTGNCVQCNNEDRSGIRMALAERREGVVVLRGLTVPRRRVKALLGLVDAWMAADGIAPSPPPQQVEPMREMTPDQARAVAHRLAALSDHTPPLPIDDSADTYPPPPLPSGTPGVQS